MTEKGELIATVITLEAGVRTYPDNQVKTGAGKLNDDSVMSATD